MFPGALQLRARNAVPIKYLLYYDSLFSGYTALPEGRQSFKSGEPILTK